jgi:purine-nucleoside phosphorylase
MPKDFNPIGAEMEAFALFYIANFFKKHASCLMSVVDSKFIEKVATADERQFALNNMIKLALESIVDKK